MAREVALCLAFLLSAATGLPHPHLRGVSNEPIEDVRHRLESTISQMGSPKAHIPPATHPILEHGDLFRDLESRIDWAAGASRPESHKKPLQYGKPRDLEVFNAQKLGQTILGAIAGSAIGVVAGDTSMGASGAQPDMQDGVGHLWAGAIGGAIAGYQLDGGKDGAPLSRKMNKRFMTAERGMANGMVAGLVGGAIAQVFSGSSDDGGSSASSGSFSSSSNPNVPTGGDGAADVPIGGKPGMLLGISANMPIIHNAVAGALGGAAAGYMEPEILNMGGSVGRGAKHLASKAENHATDFVKGRKRENLCVSAEDKAAQVQRGDIEGEDSAIVMSCPNGYLISSSEIIAKTVPDKKTLADAKAYLESLDCDGQSTCYVPACVSGKECVVPGCEFESEEKSGNVAVSFKCTKDSAALPGSDGLLHVAEACVDVATYQQMAEEQTDSRVLTTDEPKTVRVAHCGGDKVISEIRPASQDYPGYTVDDKLLLAQANDRFKQCFGEQDCFLEVCEALNCPVPGCQVDPTSKKVTTQRHFNYACVTKEMASLKGET